MEQVVCVNDDLPDWLRWRKDPVVRGQIYTIRSIGHDCDGREGLRFHEVCGGFFDSGRECAYLSFRFVPIKDKSIEVFRAIDRKIFSKKKIDA